MKATDGRFLVLDSPLMSESYLQLAEDFHLLGNVKAECKATELALKYDPQDFLCNVLHGQALMRSDRYE